MFYAQLNESNVCVGVLETGGKIANDSLVEIESYDISLLGKTYVQGTWENVNVEEEISEEEFFKAQSLLNQNKILAAQMEQDQVLAELLLGQQRIQGGV